MSQSPAESLVSLRATEDVPEADAAADARRALEFLLDTGVRIIDGDASALVEMPRALAVVIDRLGQVHRAFERRAAEFTGRFAPVLAEHARHRRCSDRCVLDGLAKSMSGAKAPDTLGRGVVVAALVLLSSLESDERWYARLAPHDRAALAA